MGNESTGINLWMKKKKTLGGPDKMQKTQSRQGKKARIGRGLRARGRENASQRNNEEGPIL